MMMSATEQAAFIKVLGPELRKGAPETEILCWDTMRRTGISAHGAGGRRGARLYRRRCLAFVQWVARGNVESVGALSRKKVYFTEQWISAHDDFMGALRWHTKNIVIGTLRNWSRTALEWNLASDPRYALHTRLGAVGALGGVTIGATVKHRRGAAGPSGGVTIKATIERNPGYYLMAHSAKFIRPGSARVHSKRGRSASQRDLSDAGVADGDGGHE